MGCIDDQLTQAELDEMLRACKNIKERLVVSLAGEAGMRAGEIAHMKALWVDGQSKKIIIPYEQGGWKVKTPNSARPIPYRKLRRLLEIVPRFFSVFDEVGLTRQGVNFIIHSVVKRTTIKRRVYPHALRSTAAQRFADAGVGEQSLCALMGWMDIRTARKYIKRSGINVERELDRADRDGML